MNTNNECYNIALIGAGNIGFRHFQSLITSKRKVKLFIVDPNETIKTRYEDEFNLHQNSNIELFFCSAVSEINCTLDLALVATNAKIRRDIVVELLDCCVVKALILEKVLFQYAAHYQEIAKLIKEKNVPTWVNCPRRMYGTYQNLREMLESCKNIHVMVSGGKNWELACNAIHMIDMIAFITKSSSGELFLDHIEDSLCESKRCGFYEINGTITGKLDKCEFFSISKNPNMDVPLSVMITSDRLQCLINENAGKLLLSIKDNDWALEEQKGDFPFQSQLTSKAVWSIIDAKTCDLPTYDESMYLHQLLQGPLTVFFESKGVEKGLCPIT